MLKSIGKSKVSYINPPPLVSKTLAVRLIGDAWITFVTKTLTTPDGLGHQDVAKELERLEQAGAVLSLRSKWRKEIQECLFQLLNCPPMALGLKCQQTDIKLLAMALDRIQNTTFKFVDLGRPDRDVPTHTVEPLIKMFHEKLLEQPEE